MRRFGKRAFAADDLVKQGALPENVRAEAERVLRSRRNILVSGGTGSGKTTLLNALIELLPDDERIVAIEDTLELRIERSNCVRFEARGLQEGAVTIRDLVRHALRHRPDHIVVGEVRGGEAADLLQALNTGHGGSPATVHANNAESALSRLASCAMQGGSGTTTLVFSYTVVVSDVDDDGIWIGNQDRTIKFDGAHAIQGTVGGLDAVLTHAEEGAKTGHKVNGEAGNTPATGAPTISGTLHVGRTQTASPGTMADADGLTSARATATSGREWPPTARRTRRTSPARLPSPTD